MNISNIVAVVTGAGPGSRACDGLKIGFSGCQSACGRHQWRSCAICGVVEEIRNAMGAPVDVTSSEQVEDALNKAVQKWGGLHAAVNCAGILAPGRTVSKRGPMDLDKFSKVIQVNVGGTFQCSALKRHGNDQERAQ